MSIEIDDRIINKTTAKGAYLLLDASPTNLNKNEIYQKQADGRWAMKVQIIGIGSSYELPIASASVLGGIKVGSGLTINPTTGVLSATGGGGTVTSVTASLPLSSSGGTTPNITISQAGASTNGYLSSTDWNTFNNKQNAITPAALTKVDDTNVTISLGGAPATALLQGVSLTLGWTGTLADARIASAATWNNKVSSISAGIGISIGGTTTIPIVTNTAPDKTVVLNSGTGISVTGTYPNFTITNSSPSSGGTVTSVSMTVPTGLSISGSPITSSGTLALTLTSGYFIPTTIEQTNWNTAYTNRITSLTTTGTSGAATLVSNVLNIPQYQAAGTYVTAVSVSTNQGVSGTSSGGATPALTISLGALTGVTSLNGLVVTPNTGVVTSGEWRGTKVAIAYGGTNSSTALSNNRIMISSGGAIVEQSAITADRIIISDTNGLPIAADTSTYPSLTELSYVKGVTSPIQTQIAAISTRKIIKTTTRTSVTTTGGTIIITSLLIPANTFAVGDILSIYAAFTVNYSTSLARIIPYIAYLNTSNTTVGALSLIQASNPNGLAASYSFSYEFYLGIQSSTATVVRTLASQGSRTINIDEQMTATPTVGVYPQTRNIDWTVNQYLILADSGANSGGTYTCEWAKIES
jgi:hypothetical protein